MEAILCKVKCTSAECKGLLALILFSCSCELTDIVVHILNGSLRKFLRSLWLNALVTSVQNVTKPVGL